LLKKIIALGTECAEYLKAARASKGELLFLHLLILHALLCLLLDFLFPPYCLVDALATANARISLLEAELSAFRKAFDAAIAAKVSAKKLNKSALAKAKKAKKTLADANKEHLQREQAVAKRLNTISAAAGGTYYTFLLLLLLFYLPSYTR
jgi:Tfp pilus assembly protein PilN